MSGTWVDDWKAKLAALSLKEGGHKSPEKGVCVMEAVAWLRNQEHTDKPVCVSPVIGQMLRSWNDSLQSDEERDRLLKPLIPDIVDTVTNDAVELRRSYMALDWLVRVNAPAFLNLTDDLKAHAVALSGLAPITDKESMEAAMGPLGEARSASAAAGAAARAAARAAAWDAARDALKPTVLSLQESAQDLVRRMARAK